MPIRSIRHRRLKELYENGETKGLPAALIPKIRDILLAIDEAAGVQDTGLFPGWRLHPLKGDLKGFWVLRSPPICVSSFDLSSDDSSYGNGVELFVDGGTSAI